MTPFAAIWTFAPLKLTVTFWLVVAEVGTVITSGAPPIAVAQLSAVAPAPEAWLTCTSSVVALSVRKLPRPTRLAPVSVEETASQLRPSATVGLRLAIATVPPVVKPIPSTPRKKLLALKPISVSVPLASVPVPTLTLVTVCVVSEKPTSPETRPNRLMCAKPETASVTPPENCTAGSRFAVPQSSGVAAVPPFVPAAWFRATCSELTLSVTPGMPVNDPLRFVDSAVHVRVSAVAFEDRRATVTEPLEIWKPTPPAPTKRFVAVSVSVVSVPLASVPWLFPSATFVTSCAENENPTVPLTTSKRFTVALPLSAKPPVVSAKLTGTGPAGVGMVIETADGVNAEPVNEPTCVAQLSARVAIPEYVPDAWLTSIATLETESVTPVMPLKLALAIWPLIVTHCRESFVSDAAGVITASPRVARVTLKFTPPAPIVRLWPTGMVKPSVVRVAPWMSGPGGPRAPAPHAAGVSAVLWPLRLTSTVCCLNANETVPLTKPNALIVAVPDATRSSPLRSSGLPATLSWSATSPKRPFVLRSSAVVQLSAVAVWPLPYVPDAVLYWNVSDVATSVKPGMPCSDALEIVPSIAVQLAVGDLIDERSSEAPVMVNPTPPDPIVIATFVRPKVTSVAPDTSAVPSLFRSSEIVERASAKCALVTLTNPPIDRVKSPLTASVLPLSVTWCESTLTATGVKVLLFFVPTSVFQLIGVAPPVAPLNETSRLVTVAVTAGMAIAAPRPRPWTATHRLPSPAAAGAIAATSSEPALIVKPRPLVPAISV